MPGEHASVIFVCAYEWLTAVEAIKSISTGPQQCRQTVGQSSVNGQKRRRASVTLQNLKTPTSPADRLTPGTKNNTDYRCVLCCVLALLWH